MKLIGLVQAAEQAGVSRRRMLTLLRAWEDATPHLRGRVLIHVGKRHRIFVNVSILEQLNARARRTLERRVAQLEAWAKGMEAWRDEVEARRTA
jgi:hypothetical protein